MFISSVFLIDEGGIVPTGLILKVMSVSEDELKETYSLTMNIIRLPDIIIISIHPSLLPQSLSLAG